VTDPVLARSLDAYRELSTNVTEDELLRSLASGQKARPCACGGVVVADVEDPTDGVRDHQSTDRHRRWRAWTES
jgi:hypothetical protein